jgi:hypothetical protein
MYVVVYVCMYVSCIVCAYACTVNGQPRPCKNLCMHMACMRHVHACMHACGCMHGWMCMHACRPAYPCGSACKSLCMHMACMHVDASMHACVCMCAYVGTHAWMWACMHADEHTVHHPMPQQFFCQNTHFKTFQRSHTSYITHGIHACNGVNASAHDVHAREETLSNHHRMHACMHMMWPRDPTYDPFDRATNFDLS